LFGFNIEVRDWCITDANHSKQQKTRISAPENPYATVAIGLHTNEKILAAHGCLIPDAIASVVLAMDTTANNLCINIGLMVFVFF
jgi:hypothetical protein